MSKQLTFRKSKKAQGGSVYYPYQVPGMSGYMTLLEIAEVMREHDVVFENLDQDESDKVFMAMLYQREFELRGNLKALNGDVQFLNRIIYNGGMVEYIKILESNL